MNKRRKKMISEKIEALSDCQNDLEFIKEVESIALSNIPENLSQSNLYTTSEESINLLNDAIDSLDDAKTALESILN